MLVLSGFCRYCFVLLSCVPRVQHGVHTYVYVYYPISTLAAYHSFLGSMPQTDRYINTQTDRRLPTFSSLDASSSKPCGILLSTFHLHFCPLVRCHPSGNLPLLVYPFQVGTAFTGSPAWCWLCLSRHCAGIICLPINFLARWCSESRGYSFYLCDSNARLLENTWYMPAESTVQNLSVLTMPKLKEKATLDVEPDWK